MLTEGLIQVYYGDGKGKTTAAIGQLIRAVGNGLKVVLVQFLKNTQTGELEVLEQLPNLKILRGKVGNCFTFQMSEEEKHGTRELQNNNLTTAWETVIQKGYDMLVLDELIDAYVGGYVDEHIVKQVLTNKPAHVELVITGHSLPTLFKEYADYITEMKKIRHPFDRGIVSRNGIEN